MKEYKSDIDQLLDSNLSHAELDDANIGWDAFQLHRTHKKRRRALLFILPILLCTCGIIIGFIAWNNSSKAPTLLSEQSSNSNNQKENISASPEVLSETTVIDEILNNEAPVQKPHQFETLKAPVLNSSNFNIDQDKTKQVETSDKTIATNNILIDAVPFNSKSINEIPYYITTEFPGLFSISKWTVLSSPSDWFWEVQAGPYLSNPKFNVTNVGRAFVHKSYSGIRSSSEIGLLGYGMQVGVGRSFGKFSLKTGLGLAHFEVNADYNFVYYQKPVIDISNEIIGYNDQSPETIRYKDKHKYSFIEIPLTAEFTAHEGKNLNTGIYLSYINQLMLQINGTLPNAVYLNEKDKLEIANYKYYTPSLESGLLFNIRLNKETELLLSPRYRLNFGLTQMQEHYKTDLNNFSLQCILRKRI